MKLYRGLTKEGKRVYGYHLAVGPENNVSHYILPHEKAVWASKLFSLNKDEDFITGFVEVIPESVGQSTGIKDKNGKEIYGEGDIYKDAEGIISVVKMAVDGWALFPVKKGIPVRNLYWHNVCDKTKGEVIGNVTENPKLLKG